MSEERSVLLQIQSNLQVPKGRENSFGGFFYRSCEDIMAAVKPLLDEVGATLTISDSIEIVGKGDLARFYVKATAVLTAADGKFWTATAYAREPVMKKGMDEAQITGTASSYARKYALSGLFLLDDNTDVDSTIVVSEVEVEEFRKWVDDGDAMALFILGIEDPDRYGALVEKAVPKTGKVKYREAVRELNHSALETARNIVVEVMELIDKEDETEARAILETLTKNQKKAVWKVAKPNQQDRIAALKQ